MAKTQLSPEEQLQLFFERVTELNGTRLIKERQLHNYKPSIQWNEDSGLSFQANELDEDDLKSFLLTFRHFTSNDEPTFFYSVYNTCYKCIKPEHEHEKQQLAKAREAWGNALKPLGLVRIIIDGQPLIPEHVFNMYINGKYFHNDLQYKTELEELAKISIPLDKMRFILTLQDLTHIINWTGNFIGYGLKNNWFDFS